MEQIRIRSGPVDVLASGTVISFKNNPIELTLGPVEDYLRVILNFEIADDETKQKFSGKLSDTRTIEITFTAIAGAINGTWTIEPLSIGFFNNRQLYLAVQFYIQSKDNKQVSLNYTFYLGEKTPSPSSVGKIDK